MVPKHRAARLATPGSGNELDQTEGGRQGVLAVHIEAALLSLVSVMVMQLEGFERLPPGIEQLELHGEIAAGPLQTAHLEFADQATAVKKGGMAIPSAAAIEHAAAKRPTRHLVPPVGGYPSGHR